MKPYSTGYNYGEEFLLFYADASVFGKVHMGRPPALKPFSIKISPKTDSTGSVGIHVQMHVRERGDGSVEEKGGPIPPGKEGFPHGP